MVPYDTKIRNALLGDTPKEKYEKLRDMQALLQAIAFPGRGTPEECWDIMDVVKIIRDRQLIDQHGEYNY